MEDGQQTNEKTVVWRSFAAVVSEGARGSDDRPSGRQLSNTGEHGEVHGLYSAGWEEEEGKMGINGRSFFGVWPLGQNTRCDVRSWR